MSSPMNSKATRPLRGSPSRDSARLVKPVSHTSAARLLFDPERHARGGTGHAPCRCRSCLVCMAPCLVQDAQIPRLSLRHKKGVQRLCSFLSPSCKPVFHLSLEFVAIACPVPPSHSLISISARSLRATHSFAVRLNLGTSRIPQQSV